MLILMLMPAKDSSQTGDMMRGHCWRDWRPATGNWQPATGNQIEQSERERPRAADATEARGRKWDVNRASRGRPRWQMARQWARPAGRLCVPYGAGGRQRRRRRNGGSRRRRRRPSICAEEDSWPCKFLVVVVVDPDSPAAERQSEQRAASGLPVRCQFAASDAGKRQTVAAVAAGRRGGGDKTFFIKQARIQTQHSSNWRARLYRLARFSSPPKGPQWASERAASGGGAANTTAAAAAGNNASGRATKAQPTDQQLANFGCSFRRSRMPIPWGASLRPSGRAGAHLSRVRRLWESGGGRVLCPRPTGQQLAKALATMVGRAPGKDELGSRASRAQTSRKLLLVAAAAAVASLARLNSLSACLAAARAVDNSFASNASLAAVAAAK